MLLVTHLGVARPGVSAATAGGLSAVRRVAGLLSTRWSVDTSPPAPPPAQASQCLSREWTIPDYNSSPLPAPGEDSEDVSLPIRHILALRCLLLKVQCNVEYVVFLLILLIRAITVEPGRGCRGFEVTTGGRD